MSLTPDEACPCLEHAEAYLVRAVRCQGQQTDDAAPKGSLGVVIMVQECRYLLITVWHWLMKQPTYDAFPEQAWRAAVPSACMSVRPFQVACLSTLCMHDPLHMV